MRPAQTGTARACVVVRRRQRHIPCMASGIRPQALMHVKEKMMLTLIGTVRTALRNHARYSQTRREIENMPLDVALDLGLSRADAHQIARMAVWG